MRNRCLLSKVKRTVKKHSLLERNDKVLVALSGGADSVCLLALLMQLRDEFSLRLHLAHLNHALRGTESNEDAEWVRALSRKFEIPITAGKRDVLEWATRKSYSLEEAAREVRYRFLSEVADDVGATKIATGHTLDDQAETVLLRLLRGTGISGVGGIPPRRGWLIRPLIGVTREEILGYLRHRELSYREDSSNVQRDHLRNRVRLELIPLLKEKFNARTAELLGRCAELAQVDNSYLATVARGALSILTVRSSPSSVVLDWKRLKALHPSIERRVIRSAISQVRGNLRGVRAEHILSCLELATGKKLCLPSGLVITREYEELVVFLGERRYDGFAYTLQVPGTLILKEIKMTLIAEFPDRSFLPKDCRSPSREEAYFDFEQIESPLSVRSRRPGDKMRPLGMEGEKKLKDILMDDKIARDQRNRIPVLADSKGILWIIGNRRSERAKIRADTKKVLRIRAMG